MFRHRLGVHELQIIFIKTLLPQAEARVQPPSACLCLSSVQPAYHPPLAGPKGRAVCLPMQPCDTRCLFPSLTAACISAWQPLLSAQLLVNCSRWSSSWAHLHPWHPSSTVVPWVAPIFQSSLLSKVWTALLLLGKPVWVLNTPLGLCFYLWLSAALGAPTAHANCCTTLS